MNSGQYFQQFSQILRNLVKTSICWSLEGQYAVKKLSLVNGIPTKNLIYNSRALLSENFYIILATFYFKNAVHSQLSSLHSRFVNSLSSIWEIDAGSKHPLSIF